MFTRPAKPSLSPASHHAFTLVELLVVIAIIAMLAALLLPALTSAKEKGKRAVCVSNLRQVGIAIQTYAQDSDGKIPFGPKAPPFTSPANFYPSTGAPTSLLSLQSGTPVGLGLLLQHHLSAQRRVLFCPGSDQPVDADVELARVGATQAQGSYYYRHAGNTQLFDNPYTTFVPEHIHLDRLGNNRDGMAIRALVMDTIFLCPPELEVFNIKPRTHHALPVMGPELEVFNIKPRTHHRQRVADILFADGHVVGRANKEGRFTVDTTDYSQIRDAFNKILQVFERADREP